MQGFDSIESYCGFCDECLGTERGTGSCQDTFETEAPSGGASDPHGVWEPAEFRFALEVALDAAFAAAAAAAGRTARRARRLEARALAADAPMDEASMPATPSILTEDWFEAAPRAFGEEQDVYPDDADEDAVMVARTFDAHGFAGLQRLFYGQMPREWKLSREDRAESWELAGREAQDALDDDTVPRREVASIQTDAAIVSYLARDEAPAARVAWTEADENRVVYMNLRFRWLDTVRMLAAKNRRTVDEVRGYPAARAIVQQAEALKARWELQALLTRYGVRHDAAAVRIFKPMLGRTYRSAADELASVIEQRRRDAVPTWDAALKALTALAG